MSGNFLGECFCTLLSSIGDSERADASVDQCMSRSSRCASSPHQDRGESLGFDSALDSKRSDEPFGVCVGSDKPAASVHNGIDRTDSHGQAIDLVEVLHHRLLVRNSDIGSQVEAVPKSVDPISQGVGMCFPGLVGRVNSSMVERSLVHRRGDRMAYRVTENAGA